ncbi:MAG TPA: DUF1800 domain-containing protein [Stellaceae bacterium]|jgi:uncharacterized protein (DUF1800 family)|nr:DUF1800 domain-containing protein [Stellaceae bacterium]
MVAAALTNALVAATRFGFAPRPGELSAIANDPRGWVLHQLDARPAPLDPNLPNSAPMVAEMLQARQDARQDRSEEAKKAENEHLRAIYLGDVQARTDAAVASDTPLLDRLTRFWSNHFTVSCVRPVIRGFAGAFEREAIRPHVTGRFVDMLLAAERHPAMLFYLDQVLSIGPNSPVGQRQHKGLNENLAREMMELHTLGVDGGYTQDDVEALARILTGWSVGFLVDPDVGKFRFRPLTHEPGAQTLLGKTYPESGYDQGELALRDLAAHPATATHVATKLARHFIADDPPKDAVQRIAKVFRDTDGDLKRVTAAIVREDAAWKPFVKVRTPDELLIATCRVTGFTPPPPFQVQTLHVLDQQPFFAPSPEGWSDRASDWIGPESVLHRADCCQNFAGRVPDPPDPAALAEAVFGETLPDDTAQAVKRAASRREGLALLIASPEFQRR